MGEEHKGKHRTQTQSMGPKHRAKGTEPKARGSPHTQARGPKGTRTGAGSAGRVSPIPSRRCAFACPCVFLFLPLRGGPRSPFDSRRDAGKMEGKGFNPLAAGVYILSFWGTIHHFLRFSFAALAVPAKSTPDCARNAVQWPRNGAP